MTAATEVRIEAEAGFEDFRGMLARMEREGQLRRIAKPVRPQHITALTGKAPTALMFDAVEDYGIPVVGGLFWTRARTASALGWPEGELGRRFAAGVAKPLAPTIVTEAACQERVMLGDQVDLTSLPIPFMHQKDGGPYISAGVAFADDPKLGPNAGCYRLMFRTRREMTIDLFTASDLRRHYTQYFERGEPMPVAIAIGVHAFEHMAAAYKAPAGVDEMEIAGGLRGKPTRLVRCRTMNIRVPADAEIILEGELLPNGWTADEGPFGEFAGMQGDLKHNPIFRVNAITHRARPIFYALQMPWENDWLNGPATEAACFRILGMIGVQVTSVRATEGGCCGWSIVVAIRKRAGEGKNAIAALLSLPVVKQVIVTDDDIDIDDPAQVEWAVTFRCQADKDVVVLSGLKGKHVDPSVRPWELPPGQLPITSKFGIDATIPEGIPAFRYERIEPAFKDAVRLEDYL
ncbi:ubiquinone biosynthesis protein UbiD [Skermanella stibiiresistens SB22]|uniref:Ubiquinone biosynthesis protein UbiD n=1 Tax=Skermanella stibiiresistens SB22 TaxID=1385369 RepID=W9GSK2_9PROT|nr:UbiD family decarboxylase [Skermanella stibiiresistens]EWY36875.1 ubiquinone biosynthesis protein UbiD [Skermanella stibiiresistens SB22]